MTVDGPGTHPAPHAVPAPAARVAVIGYAGQDHAMAVDALPQADRTVIVRRRLSRPWPAAGGAAHVARALLPEARVDLLTWVGDDDAGRRYVDEVAGAGVGTDGVAATLERTASTYLFYDGAGHTACVYDPGGHTMPLTPAQRAAVAACDWLCVVVGPRAATVAALDALPVTAGLLWVVKADPGAVDADLVRRCLGRARIVAFSRGERAFLCEQAGEDPLAMVAPDALVVETRGVDGVWHRGPEGEGVVAVDPVDGDTTGAGDTFAARLLAGVLAGATAADAVAGAVAATRAFLQARQREVMD